MTVHLTGRFAAVVPTGHTVDDVLASAVSTINEHCIVTGAQVHFTRTVAFGDVAEVAVTFHTASVNEALAITADAARPFSHDNLRVTSWGKGPFTVYRPAA